jgi:hypothetical protein
MRFDVARRCWFVQITRTRCLAVRLSIVETVVIDFLYEIHLLYLPHAPDYSGYLDDMFC